MPNSQLTPSNASALETHFAGLEMTEQIALDAPDQVRRRLVVLDDMLQHLKEPVTCPSLLHRVSETSVVAVPIGSGLIVGREAPSTLIIPDDRAISAIHFEILPEESDFVLRDRKSKHGTFVNESLIALVPGESHYLLDGDVIRTRRQRPDTGMSAQPPSEREWVFVQSSTSPDALVETLN